MSYTRLADIPSCRNSPDSQLEHVDGLQHGVLCLQAKLSKRERKKKREEGPIRKQMYN
jgi:hypothetical protein